MTWYLFYANKAGESIHEKIPAASVSEAREALECMGYENIVFED